MFDNLRSTYPDRFQLERLWRTNLLTSTKPKKANDLHRCVSFVGSLLVRRQKRARVQQADITSDPPLKSKSNINNKNKFFWILEGKEIERGSGRELIKKNLIAQTTTTTTTIMMMTLKKITLTFAVLLQQLCWSTAFAPVGMMNRQQLQERQQHQQQPRHHTVALRASNYLEPGDAVMLVGPGFLQLVLAKHMKKAGLKPIVVAPQKKLDSFFENILIDEEIKKDSTIGMPEVGDPYFGELKGVVFCAEDAILPSEFVGRVLDFTDQGKSAFAGETGAPTRVVCCLPVDGKVQKEKTSNWIPIFNNDRTIDMNWKNFYNNYSNHPVYKSEGGVGSIIRFGSLFGGSIDGPEFLTEYGLEEGMYKMSLEQYRDLRERSFDRYKLAGQVLAGNAINNKPPNQEKMEEEALKNYKGEVKESFRILGGYPEIDRTCRHTMAAAVVASLMKPVEEGVVPKEMTVLSVAESVINTQEEWEAMFKSPEAAKWPDPFTFRPESYGIEVE